MNNENPKDPNKNPPVKLPGVGPDQYIVSQEREISAGAPYYTLPGGLETLDTEKAK